MGPVNKFFNTGQICTKQVTSLESWILSEGRPAMGISFPLGPEISPVQRLEKFLRNNDYDYILKNEE